MTHPGPRHAPGDRRALVLLLALVLSGSSLDLHLVGHVVKARRLAQAAPCRMADPSAPHFEVAVHLERERCGVCLAASRMRTPNPMAASLLQPPAETGATVLSAPSSRASLALHQPNAVRGPPLA